MKTNLIRSIAPTTISLIALICIGFGTKPRSREECILLIRAGANVSIDASTRTIEDLVQIAANCQATGRKLHLRNCEGIQTTNLIKIAAFGREFASLDL